MSSPGRCVDQLELGPEEWVWNKEGTQLRKTRWVSVLVAPAHATAALKSSDAACQPAQVTFSAQIDAVTGEVLLRRAGPVGCTLC
jgi:hypothetical protein